MKTMIKVLIISAIFLAGAFAAVAAPQECQDLINNSEKLWMDNKYDESDKALDQAAAKCPNLGELYWRKARNIYDRVESMPRDKRPTKQESIDLYNKIISLAEKCISLSPNDGLCYHWKGVGLGRRGSTKGVLNSLGDLRELDSTYEKAESLHPTYHSENGMGDGMGDIYTARGQIYRVVPDWFILRTLFGVRGDMAKSVEYQRKAVKQVPQRIEYNKELGVSLICYGQKNKDQKAVDEGRDYLKKLANLPVLKNSDKVDKEHAVQLLKNPDLACGYSRDAQQSQSKEEFEKSQKK
jgi:tetratricopeptide (TPR) repeat protein